MKTATNWENFSVEEHDNPEPDPAAVCLEALEAATLTAEQFREAKFPVRRRLLGEWLCEGDYGMIFRAARRGEDLASVPPRRRAH